jgi:hypothetical protein
MHLLDGRNLFISEIWPHLLANSHLVLSRLLIMNNAQSYLRILGDTRAWLTAVRDAMEKALRAAANMIAR